jgi:glycosyltransferase involved in cell wall biosynthesis
VLFGRNTKIKILIISQYFWPENFRINEIASELVTRGYKVQVITGFPNYPSGKLDSDFIKDRKSYDNYKGVCIKRVPIFLRGSNKFSLFLNYISYPISAIIYILLNRRKLGHDAILTYQLSPIFSALPGIVLKKIFKKRLVMFTLDLWPETLTNFSIKESSLIYRMIRRITNYIYLNTDFVLLQNRAFKHKILEYVPEINNNLIYFPTWADNVFFQKNKLKKNNNGKFNILFAGNIGDAQDIESIIKFLNLLKGENLIHLHFVGDGSKLALLKECIKKYELQNVTCHGRHPVESMPEFYALADAFLVTLKDNIAFNLTLPAKVQSYMSFKKPILTMANGETNAIVNQADCGLISEAGDYRTLSENAKSLSRMSTDKTVEYGMNGFNFAQKNFNKEILMDRLEIYLRNS